MPRAKKSQTEVTTAEQGMTMILDIPVEKSIDEAAKVVGVAEIRLLEMFADRLELPEALGWETVPSEHESLLAEFKQQQDAFNSVRALERESVAEPTEEPAIASPEPPVIEEESQPKKRGGGRKKKESTALTQKKAEAIQETRQDASQVSDGIAETLIDFNAMEGLQDSSNAATAYLTAFSTNLINRKGEGASTIAAEILTRTAKKQNFNPNEVLERLGVPLSKETRENLSNVMGEMQGELQEATEEMVDTAWGNGFNPQDALTRLRNLRNLKN